MERKNTKCTRCFIVLLLLFVLLLSLYGCRGHIDERFNGSPSLSDTVSGQKNGSAIDDTSHAFKQTSGKDGEKDEGNRDNCSSDGSSSDSSSSDGSSSDSGIDRKDAQTGDRTNVESADDHSDSSKIPYNSGDSHLKKEGSKMIDLSIKNENASQGEIKKKEEILSEGVDTFKEKNKLMEENMTQSEGSIDKREPHKNSNHEKTSKNAHKNSPEKRSTSDDRVMASGDSVVGHSDGSGRNGGDFSGSVLNVHFTENRNLYTNVKVGGQLLKLALNSRLEGIYVFMKDSQACFKGEGKKNCYDPNLANNSTWCNNDLLCLPAILSRPFECYSDENLFLENKAEYPIVYYDSLKFGESHVEGSDDVEMMDLIYAEEGASMGKKAATDHTTTTATAAEHSTATATAAEHTTTTATDAASAVEGETLFQNADIKLVTDLSMYNNWSLFKDTDGILGLAGKELSCRNISVWNYIVEKNNALFAIDINFPENAMKGYVQVGNQSGSKRSIAYYRHVSNGSSKKTTDIGEKGKERHFFSGDSENAKKKEKEMQSGEDVTENTSNLSIKTERREMTNSPIDPYFPKSEIHIGDYKKDYEPIVWAEPRERGGIFSDSFMQFTIYNLEVCNNNIFGKYSSNWQGIIDLSSKCLVLPKMFWLSLMEYLPVNKNDERCIPKNKEVEFNEDSVPRMCAVDARNRPLPLLKFYISDNDVVSDNNVGGGIASGGRGDNVREVYIPLDNLIINDSNGNENYLCVVPDAHDGLSSENTGRTTKPLIKFGTYVLNNFYVVVDQENYRVGFANKKNYHYSDGKCTERTVCIGDQFYEPALNMCVNPDCSIWYFYTLNEETKKCESLSSRFYIFLLILVLLLILDIQSYFFYRRSVHVAKVSSR
ncbi:conserved Plasmodium protein, unknown function [Plasmodium ovale]|nr:conserved Plasmodium protein, unknown function [Plasmodium ovale]